MNDTTLPIPKTTTNPRRRPPARDGKNLRPGFGLNDWLTLLRRTSDLAQRRGAPIRRDIPLSEVRTHDKPYDGWIVLRGKVYNIAPYLAYHPGGSEILEKVLGRDATKVFDRYHSWVNIDGLIGPLLLGYVKVEKKKGEDGGGDEGYLEGKSASGGKHNIVMPSSSTPSPATTNNDLEFTVPNPRPPKGMPLPSLLSNEKDDNDDVEEDLLTKL